MAHLMIDEMRPLTRCAVTRREYDQSFGDTTVRDLVRDFVLRLTYTAHDMAPFARDLGYDGPPLKWDPEERRHLRARLDALYFYLFGLSREDAAYVLDTFPIVRRQDEAAFRTYRTRWVTGAGKSGEPSVGSHIKSLASIAHDRDRHGVEFVVICIWYQQIQSHKEPPRGNTLYYRSTAI